MTVSRKIDLAVLAAGIIHLKWFCLYPHRKRQPGIVFTVRRSIHQYGYPQALLPLCYQLK